MAALPAFDEIVRAQRAALAAALTSQAEHVGAALPPGLVERMAAGATAGASAADRGRLREALSNQPPLALVAFDTPGVHDYVFRVRRPVDIFGGSYLVAAFTDSTSAGEAAKVLRASFDSIERLLAREGHPPGGLIFAGGGRGCALVPAYRAESLRSAIEGVLERITNGDLWSVTAALPVWPEDLGSEAIADRTGDPPASRYAAAVSVLMARLARERSRRERFGETVEPKARRCAACRRRLATVERRQAAEWICGPCSVRRTLGGMLKKGAHEAKTFEDLVSQDDRRIAVLYADGANVGGAFQEIDSMARHRALSVAVEEAFDDAVLQIRSSRELRDADARLLCQAPIRGGDDAVLILPAFFALTAAETLVRSVEAQFELERNPLLREAFRGAPPELRRCVESFGVGVGIAIGDAHFPASFLVRYAEELLKSAKRKIHEEGLAASTGERFRSAVDFLVLASGNPLSESIRELREAHFRIPPRGREPGRILTERPYSIGTFTSLLEDAAALAKVPRTQLFAVRQEVLRGHAVSRSLWRYQHARAKKGPGWAQYRQEHDVGLAGVDELLWRVPDQAPGPGDWRTTSYLDALEVLDLLPGGSVGAGDER